MTNDTPRQSKSLLESLTILAATLVAVAHTRLELFFADLEEDREHFLAQLITALVSLFCFGVGVVLATILVVMLFWNEHRLLVLAILTGIFLATGGALWARVRNNMKKRPRLFAASLAELGKDREQLVSRR
ncbi:MAG: phage holin family protein [Porticoccaceae bacterium]|nr:phage holin family protein [Porticoccaceae bacterium]